MNPCLSTVHPFIHAFIHHKHKHKNKALCILCSLQEYTRTFSKVIMNPPPMKITFSFRYKEPKIDSLKALSSRVTPIKNNKFRAAYGNILDLLTEKVDFRALTTLVQYYDIPLRYFTFPDFQIAPTLVVFERILD